MHASGSHLVYAALIAGLLAAGCGGQNGSRAEGTSGRATDGVFSGCLERNTDTGNFELVAGDGQPGSGTRPGERLILVRASDEVELNQIIGRRVKLEGTLGPVDAIADPGTHTPIAGAGADPSQTHEAGTRGLRVSAVLAVGDTCAIEKR